MHNWDDARIYQRACTYLAKQGVEVSYIATAISIPKENGVIGYSLKLRKGWRRRVFSSYQAYKTATQLKADIYHFHDPDLMPWMFLLRLRGRKVIYDIHENFYEKFVKLPIGIKQMVSFFYSIYEMPIYFFSGIVTVSESLGAMYKHKAKQIQIVLNVPPLDATPTKPSTNTSGNNNQTIYISGQQSDKRNVKTIIKASAILKEKYPNHIIHLVGRYVPENYDQELIQLAKNLGTEKNLLTEGMLPWKENFKRTTQATVGCVFYEDNPNNRVGIPNRIFEYMACGVPILAENFYELRKIVEFSKCGILVDSTNPKEVAKAIGTLFDDPKNACEMGEAGKQSVIHRYNFESEVKGLIGYYQRIVDEGRDK